jgi:hypothetical protein
VKAHCSHHLHRPYHALRNKARRWRAITTATRRLSKPSMANHQVHDYNYCPQRPVPIPRERLPQQRVSHSGCLSPGPLQYHDPAALTGLKCYLHGNVTAPPSISGSGKFLDRYRQSKKAITCAAANTLTWMMRTLFRLNGMSLPPINNVTSANGNNFGSRKTVKGRTRMGGGGGVSRKSEERQHPAKRKKGNSGNIRAAQTGVFDLDIRISNRPFIDICKSFAAQTGLKYRNVEKGINAV